MTTLNQSTNKHYILFYQYASDYLERRDLFRDQHLKLAQDSLDRGELFLGGAFTEPADGAAIIFQGDSDDVAKSFAAADPYVQNNLVTLWYVREWSTVAGEHAINPLVI